MGFNIIHGTSPFIQHIGAFVSGYGNANRERQAIENQASAQVQTNMGHAIGQGASTIASSLVGAYGAKTGNVPLTMLAAGMPGGPKGLGQYMMGEQAQNNRMLMQDDAQAHAVSQQAQAQKNRIEYLRNATAYQYGGPPEYIEALGQQQGASGDMAFGAGIRHQQQQLLQDQTKARIQIGQAAEQARRGIFQQTTPEFSKAQMGELANNFMAEHQLYTAAGAAKGFSVSGILTPDGQQALAKIYQRRGQLINSPQGKIQVPPPSLASQLGEGWVGTTPGFAEKITQGGDLMIAYPDGRGGVKFDTINDGARKNGQGGFEPGKGIGDIWQYDTPIGPMLIGRDRNGILFPFLKPHEFAAQAGGGGRRRSSRTAGASGRNSDNYRDPSNGLTPKEELDLAAKFNRTPVKDPNNPGQYLMHEGKIVERATTLEDALNRINRETRNDEWKYPETNSTMVRYANRMTGQNGRLRSILDRYEGAYDKEGTFGGKDYVKYRNAKNEELEFPQQYRNIEAKTDKQIAELVANFPSDLPTKGQASPPSLRDRAEAAFSLMHAHGVPFARLSAEAKHALGVYEYDILSQPEIARSLNRPVWGTPDRPDPHEVSDWHRVGKEKLYGFWDGPEGEGGSFRELEPPPKPEIRYKMENGRTVAYKRTPEGWVPVRFSPIPMAD